MNQIKLKVETEEVSAQKIKGHFDLDSVSLPYRLEFRIGMPAIQDDACTYSEVRDSARLYIAQRDGRNFCWTDGAVGCEVTDLVASEILERISAPGRSCRNLFDENEAPARSVSVSSDLHRVTRLLEKELKRRANNG